MNLQFFFHFWFVFGEKKVIRCTILFYIPILDKSEFKGWLKYIPSALRNSQVAINSENGEEYS